MPVIRMGYVMLYLDQKSQFAAAERLPQIPKVARVIANGLGFDFT